MVGASSVAPDYLTSGTCRLVGSLNTPPCTLQENFRFMLHNGFMFDPSQL